MRQRWNGEVLGDLLVSDTAKVVVALTEWQGQERVDIRRWWRKTPDDEYIPTKIGVSIPRDQVGELVALLESAPTEPGGVV